MTRTHASPPPDTRSGTSTIEQLVRHYYAVVSDLGSAPDDLRSLLAPDVRVVEHPNLVTPAGAVRDLDRTLAGFASGKALLREQEFTVHEVLVHGERAAVRASWRGVVGASIGPFLEAQELVSEVAALLTVRDGLVTEHETFDCYRPFAST